MIWLVHKTSISKFENNEITPSIFSDHNIMKLAIDKRKTRKFRNTCKLNNTLLNKGSKKKLREVKKYPKTNKNGNNILKLMRCSKSSSKKGVHRDMTIKKDPK